MTSSNQLKDLLGHTVLWAYQIDKNGGLVESNSAVSELLGFGVEEVNEKGIVNLVNSTTQIKKILEESFSNSSSFAVHKIPFNAKDGSVVILETIIVPLLNESGETDVCLCFSKKPCSKSEISRDPLKRELDKFENRKKMLDAILSVIPIPIFYTDKEARYVGCNQTFEEFFGISAEKVYGKNVKEIFPDKKSEEYYTKDLELIRNNARETKQLELMDSNQQLHQMLMVKSVFPDETGATTGMMGIFFDITHVKKKEEERFKIIQEAQYAQRLESLGLLAGGVAHDFNNMLTVILGNIDLAISDIPSQFAAVDYLKDARITSLKAADLCRQMLLFTGKTPFNRQLVNLDSIIQDMNKLLEAAISRQIYLQYHLTQSLPLIESDPAQIRQVIMSLVVNASEAMGDKPGIITITTGWMKCDKAYLDSTVPVCRVGFDKPMKQGIYAFLEVTDSGCGMDSDTQKRIFDPFFTTKFFGRGLGLAAVLGIIRSHRGGIKVYSEQGKGTTFKILFPASQNEKIAAARKVETEKKQPKAIATVLVVDDEEGVRNFALKCFERMGVTVLSASNGNEALEIFAKNWDKIDAVFLDFTMPGKSSEEVFRELKLMKPVIKVVLCSGYSEEQATARFLGKGLAGFMQKPYGMVALRERLFSLLPQERLQTNDPEHNNDKRQTDNPSE